MEVRRDDLAYWALRTSQKFTTGVKYGINSIRIFDQIRDPEIPITFRLQKLICRFNKAYVDPGGPAVIILVTGSEVRGFKPGRGRWIFSERKNPEYDFLRNGSKAVGPVS